MSPVERRARRLLLAYPAAYRAERGDEILGTVIESAHDGRIGRREARGLIVGGLKVRSALHRRLRTAANLRLAALFGLVAFLATIGANALWWTALPRVEGGTGVGVTEVVRYSYLDYPSAGRLIYQLVTTSALLVLVGAAWFARTRTVAALAAVCAVPAIVSWDTAYSPTMLLILSSIAVLHRGAARLPRAWLLLAGLLAVRELIAGAWFLPHWSLSERLIQAVGILVVLWAALDGRPLLGAGFYFLAMGAGGIWDELTRAQPADPWWMPYTPAAIAAVVLIPAFLRVRRQAVL